MKKKIITAVAVILVLTIVQFTTYQTLASKKLSELAIKNIQITKHLASDTIIFGSVISVCGNEQQAIKPYNLHVSDKENFKLLKKKLAPSTVMEETEFSTYSEKVVQNALKKMSTTDFEKFMDTNNPYLNKSRLHLTAIEEQKFFVTVNYNWSGRTKEFFYEEDEYVWIFFSWLKI